MNPTFVQTSIVPTRADTVLRRTIGTLLLAAMLFTAASLAPLGARAEAARYQIDEEHLSIGFLVDHIGYQKQLGLFLDAGGSFEFDQDTQTLRNLRLAIKSESVFTNHQRRDDHLRGTDFLNAREFPEIVFEMTDALKTGPQSGTVTGNLTLIGVTKPVTMDVTLNKIADYPLGHRKEVVGISARGSFKRSDFGMNYAVENGFVGDEIALIIELEAIRQD